jgi:hypothetical protein
MRRAALTYLLLLLLAVAALDDAWAAATPDTSDDVAAAENNEYLVSTCLRGETPRGEDDGPPPSLIAACGALRGMAAHAIAAASAPGPLARPSPVDVFMPLRC